MLTSSSLTSPVPPMWFQTASLATATSINNDTAGCDGESQDWIVQFQTDAVDGMTSVEQTASLLAGLPGGFQVVRGLGQVGQVLIRNWGADDAVSAWYAADPYIVNYQRDGLIHVDQVPNDPSYPSLWGLENANDRDIDAAAAWDLTTGSSSVIVAVIDTGIDYNHPDLAANIWTNPGEIAGDGIDNDDNGFIDDIHGWDFVNGDNSPLDDHSHGTHVSGTIGAVGNNGVGVAGVNWDVSLMGLKVLNAAGNGSNSDAILALNYATMMRERGNNVRVTNNSYGGGPNDPAFFSAIQASAEAGILFVAAAGNLQSDNDAAPTYPASYSLDNIISVAATDANDNLASYSNYGLTSVDLAAPGSNILSTTPNNNYGGKSGTSMATPHVVGVAALAMSIVPESSYRQIREAILAGVDPLASLTGKVATGGRLNAKNTLNYLLQQVTATPVDYLPSATPYEAIDLTAGAAGVTTVLDDVDDGSAPLDLSTNSFTLYGTTYSGATALYVSSNGLLTFGASETSAQNTNLATMPLAATIAPFWDDLRTDIDGLDVVLAKFEDTTGDSIDDRLIIEWSNVAHYPNSASSTTFQAILQLNTGAVDGQIIFNYVDLDFGDPALDNGRSASVGVKAAGSGSEPRLLVSKDTGSNPWVASGNAIVLDRTRPQGDIIDVTPEPRPDSVDAVDVVFTQAIDPATLDYRDITLTLDGGANLVTSAVTVSMLNATTFRISGLAGITSVRGTYTLSVDMGGVTSQLGRSCYGTITDQWTVVTAPDIVMLSVTADGLTTLSATYEIFTAGVTPFDLGFYRSTDNTFGGDVLLGTVTITDLADRTVGIHTKTWTIGSGVGKVPLPGAGASEVDSDYFILAVADPTDAVYETDLGSPGTNNVAVFSGVYHAPLSPVFFHGGDGDDTITSNGSSGIIVNAQPVTYTVSDVLSWRFRGHAGNDLLSTPALTKSVWSWGGVGNDTLVGGTSADSLFGGAGDDSLTGNAGNDSLAGGTDNDTYVFNAGLGSGIDTLTELASEGTDLLDFSATTTAAIVLDLSSTASQVQGTKLTVILSAGNSFENVIGGSGNDTLTGNGLANVLNGGGGNDALTGAAGNDTLIGGIGNDAYRFDTDSSLGSDTITEAPSSGTDTIDFSSTTGLAVSISLSSTLAQTVNSNLTLTLSANDGIDNVMGGSGNDTLLGNALVNVLTGGAGNDTLAGGAANDQLIGGADDDVYQFDTDSPLGTDTINETGGGIDTLDFSLTTTVGVTINLNLPLKQVVNPNLSLLLGAGTPVENVIGGSQNDLLTGNSLNNVLSGGLGNDTYNFDTDLALGSDTVIEAAGSGTDHLNFGLTTTQSVRVELSSDTAQVVNPNLALTLPNPEAIENATGGTLNDTLIGNGAANTLTGGAGDDALEGKGGDDSLAGGLGNDTYVFDADMALGTDNLSSDISGLETLDFSPTNSVGVIANLGIAVSQAINANLSLILGSATTFDDVIGGDQGDTLTGNSVVNVLLGNGGNDTLNGAAGNDILEGGSGDDTLIGSAGNDRFRFAADSLLGSDSVDETGGGIDTLDFSPTLETFVNVNLGLATAQVINANLTLALGSTTSIENVIGGSQADFLSGNSLVNNLIGGPGDDTLAGATGKDIYSFNTNSQLGSDVILEGATGGTDTLDFSTTTSESVTVNLALSVPQIVNGNLTLTLPSGNVIENATGGALGDSLTGNSGINVLNGGAGDDSLDGADGADSLIGGTGDDTLIGGNGNDTYSFTANSALGTDTLIELNGGGIDLLDFSLTTALAVSVNLSLSGTQIVNANLSIALSGADFFEFLIGTALNDTLVGNSANNLLVGGAGADSLSGLDGRDLMIGGTGTDSLDGGNADDLLIGGAVTYYNETTKALNRNAINAVMAEWSRLDADYATRIQHLRTGGGLNGSNYLTTGTVTNDSVSDALFGGLDLDWFWQFPADSIGDLGIGGAETVN